MSDDPKKPLPFSTAIPETVDSGPVSPEVTQALLVLLADTLNHQTPRKIYHLANPSLQGRDLGSWQITVAQVG